MHKRQRKPTVEYTILSIPLNNYRAGVDASINPYAREKRHHWSDPKIYSFGSSVELEGVCDYPEERAGEKYSITVYGSDDDDRDFDARLSDRHTKDDGEPVYRRVRGEDVPVYNVPEGLGLIEKIRGEKRWSGFCWVSPGTVSDMLALLPHIRPLYISIHERKVGRTRWINGLSLQMSHPAFE